MGRSSSQTLASYCDRQLGAIILFFLTCRLTDCTVKSLCQPLHSAMNSFLLCSIVCFAFFISTGDAIKCYVCNSAINKTGCSTTQSLNSDFLKDCSELAGGAKNSVCRKIDQDSPSYEGNNSNTRVIRECGQDDPVTNTCYQKAGLGGRQYVCSCDHDGCNSGVNLQTVFTTMISFATVALLGPKFLL